MEQPSAQLLHDSLVVKEEPPEDDTETPSFCYETVTKEEVTLEDPATETTSNELPFKCSECNKSFDHVTKLNRCVRRHNVIKAGLFKCSICEKSFVNSIEQSRHERVHQRELDPKPLLKKTKAGRVAPLADCKICGKRLNKTSLKRHELIFHETNTESEKQPSEDAVESSPQSQEKDIRPSTIGQPMESQQKKSTVKALQKQRAEKRKKFFLSKIPAASVKNQYLGNDEKVDRAQYLQSFLGKRGTTLPYDLSKQDKDQDGFFNCSKCEYKTERLNLLRIHLRGHKSLELGLFTCDVCQMCFKTNLILVRHKKSHEKGNTFECHTCHEKFINKSELFLHRNVHSKVKVTRQFVEQVTVDENGIYTCSICGKTQKNRRHATSHFRLHTYDKYKCEICQLRCGGLKYYTRHMETHANPSFTCYTCNEKFENRKGLIRHKQTHFARVRVYLGIDDLYHCTRCEETFPSKQIALTHFKTHPAPILQKESNSDVKLQWQTHDEAAKAQDNISTTVPRA